MSSAEREKINFLVVSRRNEMAMQICDELETNPLHKVNLKENARNAMEIIDQGETDYLIFNFDHFGQTQVNLVDDVRKLGHVFQIFVISETVDEMAREKIKNAKDVLVIERETIEPRDVAGMCTRIANGEDAFPRQTKRYPTRQRVKISKPEVKGKAMMANMVNVSASGAYLEYNGDTLVATDLIEIQIDLPKVKKTRIVRGKVMWVRNVGFKRFAAGVHFFKEAEKKEAA